MGLVVSKVDYAREGLRMLHGDQQNLQNERDATVGRVEALEKELRKSANNVAGP